MGAWSDYNLDARYVSGCDGVNITALELTEEDHHDYMEAKQTLCIHLNMKFAPYVVSSAGGDLIAFLDTLASNTTTHGHLNIMIAKSYLMLHYRSCSRREGDKWDKKYQECKAELNMAIKGFGEVIPGVLGLTDTTPNVPKAYSAVIGYGGGIVG